MVEQPTKETGYALLSDDWAREGPVPLSGVLERSGFPPLLTAFFALLLGLVLFQGISAVAAIFFLVVQGVDLNQMLQDLPRLLEEQAGAFIVANTIGQVLGLALFSFGLVRLHTRRARAFLRLRSPDIGLLVLGIVGLFALTPVVQWLGTVNEALPLPDALRAWDQSQMELIEKILTGHLGVGFSLAMLAATPALCEELFFRGYVQRQAERGLGITGGVLASGIIFGAYHLRFTQLLPLSALGLYLAYLAWRTGSLWVPVVVHFLNNALAVATAAYVTNRPDLDISVLEDLRVPWYLVLVGVALFGLTLYGLERRAQGQLGRRRTPELL